MTRRPSGLNATAETVLVCPLNGSETGWPVSAFHSRTVLSLPPLTSRCPSGLNATLITALVAPLSVSSSWRLSAFHTRTV